MNEVISTLRRELKQKGDIKLRESEKRFFKEKIKSYGIKSAVVVAIGKRYFKEIKDLDKNEIFIICEELFKSGYNEEARIACDWAYNLRKKYEPEDFGAFDKWLEKYVDNWAKCDMLCNHSVGDFLMKYPKYILKAEAWTRSRNRWMKRGAAVSLIVPARRGLFLKEIFRIADSLFLDQDDMVQKGFGWMLKAASEAHQKEVFSYIMKNKNRMPRTALRYAIEKMPLHMKKQVMAK